MQTFIRIGIIGSENSFESLKNSHLAVQRLRYVTRWDPMDTVGQPRTDVHVARFTHAIPLGGKTDRVLKR